MTWDLLGHDWAARLLRTHIVQGRLRHAYLITGPRGLGRRTLALRLAQAVNCLQPPAPGEPCGTCSACNRIGRMQHPDLTVIQAEEIGGRLKVDQVRELQRILSLAPYEAHYRVALLLRFEEANDSAANALLKTLEEPPPQVILVLTAESAESLLPTIPSRCEVLRLSPLPLPDLEESLQKRWGIETAQARLLAHLSGGKPGTAFVLRENPQLLEQRQGWLQEHKTLLASNRVERFAFADALTRQKEKELTRQVLETWLSFWHDILLFSAGVSYPPSNLDFHKDIERLAAQIGLPAAKKAVTAIERTLTLLDRNVNSRLALEVLLLDLPKA
jgi:DNA polymerase III subunit delta'